MTRTEAKPVSTSSRWQALQTQLSQSSRITATAASAWMRRSPIVSRWRALPAGVSASMA